VFHSKYFLQLSFIALPRQIDRKFQRLICSAFSITAAKPELRM
jgi:hypothetical protein